MQHPHSLSPCIAGYSRATRCGACARYASKISLQLEPSTSIVPLVYPPFSFRSAHSHPLASRVVHSVSTRCICPLILRLRRCALVSMHQHHGPERGGGVRDTACTGVATGREGGGASPRCSAHLEGAPRYTVSGRAGASQTTLKRHVTSHSCPTSGTQGSHPRRCACLPSI